jgi:hypothetical protein
MFTLGMVTVPTRIGRNASIEWRASAAISTCRGTRPRPKRSKQNEHNQRLLEQIPMTETERKALTGDQAALEHLVKSCSLSE